MNKKDSFKNLNCNKQKFDAHVLKVILSPSSGKFKNKNTNKVGSCHLTNKNNNMPNLEKKNNFIQNKNKLSKEKQINKGKKKINKSKLLHHSNERDISLKISPNKELFLGENSQKENNLENVSIDLFRQKLVSQLESANFRILNEKLYTQDSSKGLKLFEEDKAAFQIYHKGYSSQVSQWPLNPLTLIIKWLRKKPRTWRVADFGCGEAVLAKSIPQKVISLDLIAANSSVIKCDMANTPLDTNSINVVVCCLSLMGTNVSDFILEANRVLSNRGILKIAEVESRFGNVNTFIKQMLKFGFKCIIKNQEHKYFWLFDFLKKKNVTKSELLPVIKFKPCIYKKR